MAAIDLVVLGMIKAQPQSAYELQKSVEYRNISKWVKVSTPSIYKNVVWLEEKGYLEGDIIKEGKMPEKTVYRITESGEKYFLTLMEEMSGKAVHLFLDFNAVIMSLNFVSDKEKEELLGHISHEIGELKSQLEEKQPERQHVPLTGRTILDQQLRMAKALEEWITDFKEEYLNTQKREG